MKPLAIELFAGACSWSRAWCALGGRAVAFDIEHLPHHGDPPDGCDLVLQNVLTLHGAQFKDAHVIFASPPCQNYSYLAMPWSRSEDWVRPDGDGWQILNSARAKAMREQWLRDGPDNRLFDACFRIQREAIEAAGRYIPLIVENVKGAEPWVGPAKWHYGSFYLFGDVPALMPINIVRKNTGGSWFAEAHNTSSGHSQNHVNDAFKRNPDGLKVGSYEGPGSWKVNGKDWRDPVLQGIKTGIPDTSARKAASALIARIPHDLAAHLAQTFFPVS